MGAGQEATENGGMQGREMSLAPGDGGEDGDAVENLFDHWGGRGEEAPATPRDYKGVLGPSTAPQEAPDEDVGKEAQAARRPESPQLPTARKREDHEDQGHVPPRTKTGRHLRHCPGISCLLVMTPGGVVGARGFHILPLEERWDPKGEFGLEAMNGLLWDLETRERAAPVAAGQEEERREIIVPYPAPLQPQAPRRRYVQVASISAGLVTWAWLAASARRTSTETKTSAASAKTQTRNISTFW